VLKVTALSAGYDGLEVVHNVDLAVAPGSLTALVGANGAGKTTLLKAIAGVIANDGAVELVPEGRHLFPDMTVEENIELGGFRVSRSERRPGIDKVMQLFPRLAERRRQRAGTMSGGEQQMLAIGRALVSRPRLLMLDEPSLGLAPRIVGELFKIVRDINASGTSVLLVEQNVRQALRIATYCYVLERGSVAAQGAGEQLLQSDVIRQSYLGTM